MSRRSFSSMQPTSARDFLKVARQRLDPAIEIMEKLRRSLESQYIGGYSVECSFKALIMEKSAIAVRPQMLQRLTRTATYHRPEVLLDRLRDVGIALTPDLARRMRRFDWSSDLRYETGRRDTGETNALLRTAGLIYQWVEPQIT